MTIENPYEDQTEANTSQTWLADQVEVDLDLDGIREYATNMITIKENLGSHTGYLSLLGSIPTDAWDGGVLGEAAYVRHQMLGNYGEFRQYLTYLGIALDNIGMAARTIADLFDSTDGWSAADLNAVNWAFGDRSATRPDNVPSYIGDTFWDKYFEARNDPAGAPPADSTAWVDQGQVTGGPFGMVTQTATGPNGQIKKVTTYSPPGSGTITTTTIYNARGDVVSTTTSRTSTYTQGDTVVTRTVTTDGSGRTTGSQEERTTYDSDGDVVAESRENRDAEDAVTSATSTRTNADGTQTTTTSSGGGPERTVVTGEQTEGVNGPPESPAQQALEDIQNHDYLPG